MPILADISKGTMTQTRYDAVAPLAADICAEIDTTLASLKERLAPMQEELRTKVDSLYLGMRGEADDLWKVKVISEAHERKLDEVDKLLEGDIAENARQIANGLESDKGWIVPRPVDTAVVEAVVKRDRAAAAAEKALKG
jgi:hypothetical protein